MSAAPGDTLVVFEATELCDACGQEHRLITDGLVAYATVGDYHDRDAAGIARELSRINVVCGRVIGRDEYVCPGATWFDLTAADWRAATPEDRRLLALAERIDT